MEQSAKNRIKKFLTLLKQAQNPAFVGLVADNLSVELSLKPWKVLRVINFIIQDVSKSNSDFTRLKINEGLIPTLFDVCSKGGDTFINSIVERLNSDDLKIKESTLQKL
jgi:hypothetical protein